MEVLNSNRKWCNITTTNTICLRVAVLGFLILLKLVAIFLIHQCSPTTSLTKVKYQTREVNFCTKISKIKIPKLATKRQPTECSIYHRLMKVPARKPRMEPRAYFQIPHPAKSVPCLNITIPNKWPLSNKLTRQQTVLHLTTKRTV